MNVRIPGRSASEKKIDEALNAWSKGTGGILFIEGEPGQGKTHALDAIADAAKGNGKGPVIRVDCTPPIGKVNLAGIQPLQPFGKAIEKLYLEGEQAAKKRLAMNIGMSLLASLPIAGDIFYAIKAISQDMSEYKRETAAMQHKKRAAVTECIETLERIAEQTPFILLVDDGHWSDPQSIDVLRQLRRRISDSPLLIVWTVTPSVAQRANLPLASLLREPLSQAATAVLDSVDRGVVKSIITNVDENLQPSDKQVEALFDRSGGTPGILVEYIAYLKQTGQIRTDGTIEADALEHSGVKLGDHPATDILLHEIESEDALTLALCAAEGQEFTAFMIAALLNTDVVSAVRELRRLQSQTGVIKSLGMRTRYGIKTTTYEFTGTVPYTFFLHYPEYEERKQIHQRIAEVLSKEHDTATLDEVKSQLAAYIAVHSVESEDDSLAARMFEETAVAAEAMGSNEMANSIRSEFISEMSSIVVGAPVEESGSEGDGGNGADLSSIDAVIRQAADALVRGDDAKAREYCSNALEDDGATVTERVTLLCLSARAEIERGSMNDATSRVDEAAAFPDLGMRDTCMIINVRAVIAMRSGDLEGARGLLHEAAQYAGRLSGALRLLTLGNIVLLQREAGEKVNDRYQRTVDRALENRSWSGFKSDLQSASQ